MTNNTYLITDCPFCQCSTHRELCGAAVLDEDPGPYFIFCHRCQATGPEGTTEAHAVALWNVAHDHINRTDTIAA